MHSQARQVFWVVCFDRLNEQAAAERRVALIGIPVELRVQFLVQRGPGGNISPFGPRTTTHVCARENSWMNYSQPSRVMASRVWIKEPKG